VSNNIAEFLYKVNTPMLHLHLFDKIIME